MYLIVDKMINLIVVMAIVLYMFEGNWQVVILLIRIIVY